MGFYCDKFEVFDSQYGFGGVLILFICKIREVGCSLLNITLREILHKKRPVQLVIDIIVDLVIFCCYFDGFLKLF